VEEEEDDDEECEEDEEEDDEEVESAVQEEGVGNATVRRRSACINSSPSTCKHPLFSSSLPSSKYRSMICSSASATCSTSSSRA